MGGSAFVVGRPSQHARHAGFLRGSSRSRVDRGHSLAQISSSIGDYAYMMRFSRLKRADVSSEPPLDAAAIVRQARRLRFRVRPAGVSALAGAYLGARPGTGLTFAELRAYEPGDDVRHLDWNVTARQGRPYV